MFDLICYITQNISELQCLQLQPIHDSGNVCTHFAGNVCTRFAGNV